MIHSYPWYFQDWRDSESRMAMTMEERGLYRELLDYAYKDGSLPADEATLRKIAGATEKEWKRSAPKALARFRKSTEDGRLYHHRVDSVLVEVERWHEQRRNAGIKSAEAKRQRKGNETPTEDTTTDPTTVGTTVSPPLQPSSTTTTTTSSTSTTKGVSDETPRVRWQTETFRRFWEVVWVKIARSAAERAWKGQARTPEIAERIIAAAREQGPGIVQHAQVHGHSVLHPATWLNAGRWEDDVLALTLDLTPQFRPETVADRMYREARERERAQ